MPHDNIVKLVPRIAFDTVGAGGKPLATIENLEIILKAYQITVHYNPISKDIDVTIPGTDLPFENRVECATAYITSICHDYKMPSAWVYKYLVTLAYKNRRNPVAEWIASKEWDGHSRLEAFYATITTAPEDEALKKILLRRWMISAVAAAHRAGGISAGGMIVFQGEQYLGKTNWFKNLVPLEMRSVIKDGLNLDIKDKDSKIYCFSRWLVELGELQATFKASGLEGLKAFITADMDMLRVPYGQNFSSFPRSTVFFGSVNEKNFLHDPTGNRRFWTICCLAINHTHGLDMQQIWAEFKYWYDEGEGWYLTQEELEQLNEVNTAHEFIDPMAERLHTFYDWDLPAENFKTATQILEDMGYKNIGKSEATRVGIAIAKLNKGKKHKTKGITYQAVPNRRT